MTNTNNKEARRHDSALLAEFERDVEHALEFAQKLAGLAAFSSVPFDTLAHALFLGRRLDGARRLAGAAADAAPEASRA